MVPPAYCRERARSATSVPVSKTKQKHGKKLISKEARRKLRRWTFLVTVSKDGSEQHFQPPALVMGDSQTAHSAADKMREDIAKLAQFAEALVTVAPQPQETVSIEVLRQIQGVDEQLTRVTITLKAVLVDLVKLEPVPQALAGQEFTPTDVDQEANERRVQYVKAARAEIERRKMLEAGIDPETVLSAEQEREVAVSREFGPDGLQGEQALVPDAESWINEQIA